MKNRLFDTAKQYVPTYHPKLVAGAKIAHDKPSNGQSSKASEKNEVAMSEPSQEQQVYLIDDSSNADDDDDESQMKYVYSLYKNRLSNNF